MAITPDAPMKQKEATILELSRELNKQLEDLLTMLENSFQRCVAQEEGEAKGEPTVPNVLDEIIANAEESSRRVSGLKTFCSQKVIPKIH